MRALEYEKPRLSPFPRLLPFSASSRGAFAPARQAVISRHRYRGFGSQAEFKRRFFVPIQAMRDADAVARLKKLTGPFVLKRLKTDKLVITGPAP